MWKTQSQPSKASSSRRWSSAFPSTSRVPGRLSGAVTNRPGPVRKSSMTTTSTPLSSSRSASVLPMNPAPPVTQTRFIVLERESCGDSVAVEHLHGLERELLEVLAEQVQLRQEIARHGNDLTADLIGLY